MEWVRPISDLSEGSLISKHYTLDNGKPTAPLDIIKISIAEPRPEISQPENWLLQNSPWRLVRTLSASEAIQVLSPELDSGPILLGSTADRITISSLGGQPISASLTLIEPKSLSWHVTTSIKGARQTRAIFSLGGQHYNIVVTDPAWHAKLGDLSHDVHSRNVCGVTASDKIFFAISLGKPMKSGECFKLVASVLVLPL